MCYVKCSSVIIVCVCVCLCRGVEYIGRGYVFPASEHACELCNNHIILKHSTKLASFACGIKQCKMKF